MKLVNYIVLALMLSSCGTLESLNATVANAVDVTSDTQSTAASITAGLYFAIDIAPDDNTSATSTVLSMYTCKIPVGTASGTTATCNVSIPEGTLHYGKMTMTVGSSDTSSCARVQFYPYGFRASNVDPFTPPMTGSAVADIDCLATPVDPGCYDGPATDLYTDYPHTVASYFSTTNQGEASFEIPSANSKNKIYNTWAANAMNDTTNADSVTVGPSTASTYVGNSMQNYMAVCRDSYNEIVYQLTVKISTVPYPSAGVISFPGWN